MILVTGATGTNGVHVVNQLSARGAPVRALAHSPVKAAALRLPGVQVVTGDLGVPDTLGPALRGVERALLLPANTPTQVDTEAGFIDAAKKAGVRHVVKFSVLGADPDSPARIAKWHGLAERHLAASGLASTVVRPATFMQNFLWQAKAIGGEGVLTEPLGDRRVAQVDARDIAAVLVAALTGPGHEGKTYTVTGAAAFDMDEAAATFTDVLGRPVSYRRITPEQFRAGAVGGGMPDWMADALLELQRHVVGPFGSLVSDDVRRVTGREPTRFRQFVADHLGQFRPAERRDGA